MHRHVTSILVAVIPLAIVACVSVAIVGGVVAWVAARDGIGPGEVAAELSRGRQAARPVLAQGTSLPTVTLRPSPTQIPIIAVTPEVKVAEATLIPQPTEATVTTDLPSPPTLITPSPPAAVEPQSVPAIESPIHPGSPLPERPATRLVIPAMELDIPVTISPIVSQTWKVDHLGRDFVGHLEGTASPGDPSNIVLAGHVTIAHNVYGPFAGLGQLKPDDPIIVYLGDQPYTYFVDYRQLVDRTDVDVAFPTDTGRVTLITCSNWSDELGAYQQRLIVVGHLASGGS